MKDEKTVRQVSYLDEISFFSNLVSTTPISISFEQVKEKLTCDETIKRSTLRAREALQSGDREEYDRSKRRSGAITPAVVCTGGHAYKNVFDKPRGERVYSLSQGEKTTNKKLNILSFTGVSMVDMDHVPSERMAKVLELCRADEHTLMVWTTASGSGVRVLFRYRAVDVVTGEQRCSITRAEYEQAWHAGNSYYAALCHTETDPHTKDATRMSFLCHDPEALLRVDAMPLLVPLGESPCKQKPKWT